MRLRASWQVAIPAACAQAIYVGLSYPGVIRGRPPGYPTWGKVCELPQRRIDPYQSSEADDRIGLIVSLSKEDPRLFGFSVNDYQNWLALL